MTETTAALYRPEHTPVYVPSLAIALDEAQRALAASEQVDILDHEALIRHSVSLDYRMRVLLAALDTEGVLPR